MDSPFPYVRNLIRSWFRRKRQLPIRRKPAGRRPLFDILEDRIVPVTGVAQITLNTGTVATPASTITGSPSAIIPVFIDFDNQTAAGTIMGNDSVVFPTTNPNVDTITRNTNGSVTFKYNNVAASGGAVPLSTSLLASTVQANLHTISALANVTVAGNAGGPYTVTFPSGVSSTLLTVASGTGSATVTTVNCTFSYNGSQGPALGFPSTPTATQFQTYLQSVPGLSGSAISSVSGSGTSVSPFLITFGNGIKGGSLLTSNNSSVAITGGSLASASIYVLYDPSVLSINETASTLGSDIKASTLLNSSSGYTLQVASGFATGVAAIGLTHSSSSPFIPAGETGHLFEIDFHVLQTAPVAISTLLDLQGSYVDGGGTIRTLTVADFANDSYGLTTTPAQYSYLQNLPILTHAGALSPGQFTPSDTDTTDASIQIVAGAPKIPTAVADNYTMAPNNGNFGTTMAITGQANGVLSNDTATGNGPMNAILTGTGVSTVSTVPTSNAITSATETGNIVTIATASTASLVVGEGVTITGIGTGYNGSFTITSVDTINNVFTYIANAIGLNQVNTGTAITVATTVATANTSNGTVWLNERDGSIVYTPASGFSGTDTFTYEAEDAVSTATSANTTVTISVGGYIYIPQNLTTTGIGDTIDVPVNILDPNPANSGGLANITLGINYDPSLFSVSSVNPGALLSNANWSSFNLNTSQAGQIIVTASDTGGAAAITSTTGGTLLDIIFSVTGVPATGSTSVVNISGSVPAVSQLDYVANGTPVVMPLMVTPQDNINFNGPPGIIDGLVTFQAPDIGTTTTVGAAVAGSPVSTITYGLPVTLTATVAPDSGAAAPTAGSVDFKDGTTDLGTVNSESISGTNAIFTLVTTVNQLQVIAAGGGVHNITATYIHGTGFNDSPAGTVAGGLAVTPAPLTITATTNIKGYDSTTTAAAVPTVSGLIGSDSVTGLAEAYSNRNAGSSKTINVSAYAIQDGNGGLDYSVTTVANTTGVINMAALTLTALTNTKTYSASTAASAVPTVSGLIGGDTATGLAEAYADANVGASKTLSVSAFTVNDGNSGNNYTLTTVSNSTGQITKAPLTITAAANTKTYDSTTSATAAPVVTGKQGADIVTATEVYSDANAGTSKTLSIGSYTVQDGNSGNNYTITLVASAAGTITKAPLTLTASTSTKAYDSTTSSSSTPIVSGLLVGDSVTGLTEVFANANAGTAKTLSVSAYTVNDGNAGGNYVVSIVTSATGSITKAALTLKATTATKTYDSTTQTASTPSVTGLLGNDTATGLAEVFADDNAGSNKTLTVSAFTVNDGNGGGNYSVTTTSNTTGVINKAPLIISAATNTKTYDSTTTAAATPCVSGLQGSDSVTGLAEVYSNANAATGKTLSISTYTISDGNGGANYAVTTAANATGVISKATLTLTAVPNTKGYDSTTTAAAVPNVAGLQGNDSIISPGETYTSASAGSGKTLTPSGGVSDGTGGNNYTVTLVSNSAGVINKANLTITAVSNTKSYDAAKSAAAVPTVSGLIGGDGVGALSEVYANVNAGTGKTLSVISYTVNDGNSGNNYSVILVSSATGVINKASLTITALPNTKSYDATPSAATAPTVSGLFGSDAVTGRTEVYSDANVGTGKTLSVSAYTVSDGNGGGNYTITLATSAAGVINMASLTITASANTKVYDATTSAAAAPTVSGLVGSDAVTGRVEVYADANVGAGKALSVSAYTVSDGNGGGNYAVTLVSSATGVISPAPLLITAVTNTKGYDGTSTAAATPSVSGLRGSDSVTGLTEIYANRNAGTGKTLSVSAFTISDGNSGANYAVTTAANTTGQINKAPLTFSAVANTKTYDSTTSAAAIPTASGLIGGDTVTGLAEAYDTANVGSGKTLSVVTAPAFSATLTGLNGPNAMAFDSSGNLFVANGNGNTVSKFAPGAATPSAVLTGLSIPEALAFDGSGNLYVVNLGNGTVSKFVPGATTPSATLTGLTGLNGSIGIAIDASGDLFVASYDNGTISEFVPGATTPSTTLTGLSQPAALAFDTHGNLYVANAAANTVSVFTPGATTPSNTLTGLNRPYSLALDAGGTLYVANVSGNTVSEFTAGATTPTATITGLNQPIALALDAGGNLYVANYSGGTVSQFAPGAATPSATVAGLTGPFALAFDGGGNLYVGYLVNAGGASTVGRFAPAYTINDGNSGGNYAVNLVTNTTGVINKAPLTITAGTNNKVYNSTTNAVATPAVSGLIGADTVTGLAEVYSDKNAGTSKTLSVSAYAVSDGNSGNNYTVTTVANTTGSITTANLTITALANTKNFDGNVSAATKPTVTGLLGNDSATGLAEVYTDPSAGTGKTLSVSAYTINDGNSGSNYNVATATNSTGVIAATTVGTSATLQTSQASIIYGTSVTFTITVTALSGSSPPTGAVEVFDNGTHDLGAASAQTPVGTVTTYIWTTAATALNVVNPAVHVITANYNASGGFGGSTATLAGGETVTPKALTFTATTSTKTYDATSNAPAAPTVSGLVPGDSVTGLAEAFSDANIGSNKTLSIKAYTINDNNGGNNYSVSTVSVSSGTITKASLTITATTNTKTYDSTSNAAALPTIAGLQGADSITNVTESYITLNAGTSLTLSVNPGYTVNDGNGGGNYSVAISPNTTGTINLAHLTLTALTFSKTYDSTTAAGVAPSVTGLVGGDSVTNRAEVFSNTNAGSGKTLSVSTYTINDGNGGNNYILTTLTNTTGLITKAILTITAQTSTKTYDSTTAAAAVPTVAGLLGSDSVTSLTEVFASANADSGKTLLVGSYTVNDGSGSNNYTVSTVANTTGLISKAPLTITALTSTKTYTSTTTAGATPSVSGLQGGDNINSLAEVFADAQTGPGKILSVSPYTIVDGNGGNNYAVSTFANTTGLITKASLTITATANTKSYDATTTAGATPIVSGLVGGDSVGSLTEVYADANAGTGKTLSIGSYTVLDGNAGNNYTVTTLVNAGGVVSKALLTITATTNTKTYDATTTAPAAPQVTGLQGPDNVAPLTEIYSNAGAGQSKTLSIGVYTVNDGNSGNNYSVTTVVNTTGRITKAPLTITATTNTKTYDSTTASAAAPSVAGLMGADSVAGLAEVYANANAGTGKALSIAPYTVLDGNSGNNYLVTTVTAANGVITKASLTISAAPNTKIYDSSTAAAAVPVASGQIGGDRVTGMAEVSSDAKADTGKTLSVSAYTVNDGNGGNNYTVTTIASAAGVINQAPLTITATTNTKTYDSTTSAAAIPTVTGLIGNDAPTSLTEVYVDVNVGSSKTLSVSAYAISDGNGGNNYAVSTAVTTTGAIVAGPMVYSAAAGTPTSYTLLVQGTNFEVVDASQNILASQPLADTSAIIINGHAAGSDALTLDYSGGDPLFNGTTNISLTFNGGAANLATLNLEGPLSGLTYDATSPHAGDLKIQDTAAHTGIVNFTGLAPINVDTSTTTVAINITDNSLGHTATFSAGPAGQDTVSFSGGLEGLTFNNPTKSLTVTGATVPDTFTFSSLDSGFNASLNITGKSGSDITNLNLANLVVGSASASQAVTISTNTINLGSNIDATGGGTNTGSISLTGNVTLQTNVALSYSGANGLQISGPINLAANKLTVDDELAADAGSISGTLSGIGGMLTKGGPGSLKLLGGGSNYTGTTTIQGGKLQVGATNATSAASNINITGSGTLDLDGNNTAVGSLSGSGSVSSSVAGAATLTVTGGGIFGGNIANGAGSVGLTVASATQTLTLSGTANTYSGATTINGGDTLLAGGPGVLSLNSSITVNGTLDMAGNNIAVSGLKGSGTVLSSVAGAATLTVSGGNFSGGIANGGGAVALAVSAGALILMGTNTYAGATTISSTGTLQVDGSITSAVTNSGRLQGTGTITGNVSGTNIFEPGDGDSSPGILTINGNFTPTGILRIALGGTGAGTQYGQFNVSGNANLAGANLTMIRSYAPSGGDTFSIVTVGGASTVTPFTSLPDLHNVPFLPDNLTIHYLAHQVTLTDDYITTTTVNVSLNGTAVSAIAVGTSVTLTATVVPAGGISPPTLGFVQFQDGGTSLGTVTTATLTGTSDIFTLITTPQQLQVILTNGGIHTITAIYTSGAFYNGSQGTFAGGLQVTPIPLNFTPAANLTSYTLTSDGVNLNVVDSSNNVLGSQPLVDTSGVNINAQSQGNTLTLDYNNGDPLFNGNNGIPVNFNGGTANQATLNIVGPLSVQEQQIDDITYDPSNPHAGNLLITDPDGNTGTVNFTGLAPILISTSLSTVTISVSDNSAPHTATFTAGAAGYNLVTFDGGLENMTFKNPSAALIVSGSSMADTFNFVSLDSGFNAGLEVFGNSGNDITNLNIANLVVNAANAGGASGGVIPAVTKGTAALGPTIDINTHTINLYGNIDVTGGGTNNGSIELTGNVNLETNVTLKYDGLYNPPAPALPAGLQINGPVNLGGNTLKAIDENATDTGIIVGALTGTGGALVKSGAGTLVLQGIGSSYTGTTTIQSGTLQVGVANATSPNSNFIDNGDLDLNGSSTIINSLSGSGEIDSSAAGSANLTVDGGGNFSGDINDDNGSVGITVGGVGQTLVLSGTDNTYSGPTSIGSGDTLKVGAPAATSANSSIFNNGTFDLSGFSTLFNGLSGFGVITNNAATPATFTSYGTGTFNGGITNGGSPLGLTVASGSLDLAGTNSYTGPTAISAPATLQVDQSIASNVNNSGTLRGQGAITGSVIGNGTFAPGTGIGTMTVNGTFTPTGGTINIIINGTNALSRLVVNGAANLSGASLSLSGNASYVPASGTVFTILSATSLTGTFNKLPDLAAVLLNGHSMTIHYATTGVTLTANYATTTTVSATVGGAAATSVVYGTPVTLQATVAPPSGMSVAPTAGSVDFQDGTNDLGVATVATQSGTNSIFTLITTVSQLQVLTGSGSSHTITATYNQATLFSPSSGTLANGLTVTPAPLTITALTQTKTYDATSAALATPTVAGLVGSDTVSGLTEAFNNGNATSGKQLSVSGYTINDGNGSKDYAVTLVANPAGQITAAPLTIRATTSTKTYDATASSGATPTISGLQGQDKVTNLGESFSDANAGSSKALTVNSGYTINDGNGGSNYVVTTTTDTAGVINKAPLTITATTSTKTYNRSTGAGATPSVAGLFGTDNVSGLAEAFSDAKAGTGKTLSVVPGFVVNDGNGGKNYAVTLSTDSTGVINKAFLTIAAGTNTKTYDATTAAAITPALTGLIPGDTVTGMVEAYTDINAGSGKTLSVSTYSINDGNNGNNYFVTTVVAATGIITPAPLTIAAVTNIKTYDGTKAATTTPIVLGLLGNDSVTNRTEAYVSANAGINQTLSVTAYTINDGAGGNNYAITTLTASTGVINKASLLIAATTSTKVYDSKTTATATPTVAGLIGSDLVTGLSESYTSANAGAGKSLIVNAGYTVSDGNGGSNYSVTTLADVTGSITRAPLTLTATANTKVYDSKTTAATLPVASGLIGSDTISGLSETYSSANTGTSKALNVSSAYTLQDGNGGNNYAVTTVPSTAGQVTKAPLTITAITSTITYNATTITGAIPVVSGLIGGDSVSGLAESFSDPGLGTGKTLSVNPSYSVSDGNNGNNYTVATASNATGAIIPGPVNKFVVTIPGGTTVVAGVPFNFTIQAADFYGNPVVNYAGPITASTSVFDPLGSFPINSAPLQLGNIGYGFFLGTLKTTGTYTVNISAAGGIAGASVPITVIPAATSFFSVTTAPSTITGTPINVTVSAFDAYNNINYNYNGTIKLSSTDGSALVGGNYSFTTGPGQDNGTHTFSVTLKTPGTQFITALDVNTLTLSNTSVGTLARGLQVTSVTPTATGFTVSFDKSFFPGDITLYGASAGAVADVVLTAKSGNKQIHGSILVDPTNQSLTFKATSNYLLELNGSATPAAVSAVLPDDTYTITILSGSGSNGFIDALGAHLDGASNNGAANYTTTFTTNYQANATPVLGIPDFARGPDANTPILVPTTGAGIPITLYNAANVTDVTFSLSYNSALLHPTGTLSGSSGSSDATSATSNLVLVSNVGGVATFHYTDTAPHSATPLQPLVLGDLIATVPSANFAISSITESGNLVTVATSSNENFSAGQSIAINGVTNSVYNSNTHGNGLFTIVNTISANRFTFNLPAANQAPSSGGVAGVAALGLYQQKELLQLGNIIINKGAITGALSSSGLHVNAYIGDVNGDGVIDGLDKIAANNVAQGKSTGLSSYAQLDPTIVGDPANDLTVDAGDVTTIDSYVAALSPTQIPVPPTQQPASSPFFFPKADLSSPNAADPTLSLNDEPNNDSDSSSILPPSSFVVSVNIDHPDPKGSTGLNAASLALTFDPAVLAVSADDITLGSIPSRGSGWQLSAVVDQATGQIGIQLYSSTPITTNQGGSLVNIAFHPLASSEQRGVSPPVLATTTVQLVNSATPNGQHFDTGLTDSQSGMILSPGIDQVEVPTGVEPLRQPAFASAVTPTDAKAGLEQQTLASMFPGPLLPVESEEPTAIALLANGSTADQATMPRQAPANLVVSGALAFQPSRDVLATRPWDVQVIQIAASPEFASRPAQPIVDRLFLALAHASEAAGELSLLAPIWDAFTKLDWLEESSVVPEKNMSGRSDAASAADAAETDADLEQVFGDLGSAWGDFDTWG